MNKLETKAVQTVSSREVAEMMGKAHWEVLKMIEGYEPPKESKSRKVIGIIQTLADHNVVVSDYFIESSYKDASGKSNKCYECTKLGCELLANKLIGEKGILFTARYVNKFNKMEQYIKEQIPQLSERDYAILDIVNAKDDVSMGIAIKRLENIVTKPLIERIEEIQPKADWFEKFINSQGLYSSTQLAKILHISSARKLNEMLNEKGIIYRQGKSWLPYATTDARWYKVVVGGSDIYSYTQLKFTPKGVYDISLLLEKVLKKEDVESVQPMKQIL